MRAILQGPPYACDLCEQPMRKRIYDIIDSDADKYSAAYSYFMVVVIAASLVPLAFKHENTLFEIIDLVCLSIFIADYILRWMTADYKYGKHNCISFIRYPFSLLALIDLITILPSLTIINNGFKMMRLLRMARALKVLRVLRLFRYSKDFEIISNVLYRSRRSLLAVSVLAGEYVLASALLIFNVEPDSFQTFFDAIYWAVVSLTTVGYGDIYPTTIIGRTVAMFSSVAGIAIVALPAGILTAGYMTELSKADAAQNSRTADGQDSKAADG